MKVTVSVEISNSAGKDVVVAEFVVERSGYRCLPRPRPCRGKGAAAAGSATTGASATDDAPRGAENL